MKKKLTVGVVIHGKVTLLKIFCKPEIKYVSLSVSAACP